MRLLQHGVWGPYVEDNLKALLLAAFRDFRGWTRAQRISCSQRPFRPRLVLKQWHGHYMSCKAWNGRVVLQWLAQRSMEAAAGSTDACLLTQAAAMKPV